MFMRQPIRSGLLCWSRRGLLDLAEVKLLRYPDNLSISFLASGTERSATQQFGGIASKILQHRRRSVVRYKYYPLSKVRKDESEMKVRSNPYHKPYC